jgi:hypothetical protein
LDSENSQGVSLEEVTFGVDYYDKFAVEYQRNLAEYLIEERANFPQFISSENKGSSIRDTKRTDEGGDLGDWNDTMMII